jgi:thiol:disulfide interchange protein
MFLFHHKDGLARDPLTRRFGFLLAGLCLLFIHTHDANAQASLDFDFSAGVQQHEPLPPGAVQAAAGNPRGFTSDAVVRVAVAASSNGQPISPGTDFILAVVMDHAPKWHSHTNDPQVPPELGDPENYIRTAVAVDLPPGSPLTAHIGYIQWPEAETIEVAFLGEPVPYDVFSERAVIFIPMTVAADASPGQAELEVMLVYQACDDTTCKAPVGRIDPATGKPADGQILSLTLDIQPVEAVAQAPPLTEQEQAAADALFGGFDGSVWPSINAGVRPSASIDFDLFGWSFTIDPAGAGFVLLLLVAALGGLLLNATPCVLPVIPIKAMSLAKAAEASAARITETRERGGQNSGGGAYGRLLLLGGSMSIGIIAFWLAIGGAIAFISGFDAINKLFQLPWFTLGVGIVIAVMAVGMGGLFTVALPRQVYNITPKQDSVAGSFGLGIMTAILSTPCTAPFMGTAATWATQQTPGVVLATFVAIGSGMALPYFLLAAFPKLVDKVPRAGATGELVKQVMGLCMLAAAAYFIGVGWATLTNDPPDPPSLIYWWVVGGLLAAAGLWLAARSWQVIARPASRVAFNLLGLSLIVGGIWLGSALSSRGPIDWIYYTPERFEQALADGEVVVMDFTAEWCLNCKAMERQVLYTDRVVALSQKPGVSFFKVDITSKSNVAGTEKLAAVGRVTIPALVVFDAEGKETFNGDFYTVGQVLEAVEQARQATADPA